MIGIETDGSRHDLLSAILEACPSAVVFEPGSPTPMEVAQIVSLPPIGVGLPAVADRFERFGVELLFADGQGVVADVAELRYRTSGRIAARLSLDPAGENAAHMIDLALDAVDDRADGAATVTLVDGKEGLQVEAVARGLVLPLPPSDAAFVAWGLSAPHLLAESIARPQEFRRRLAHSRRRRKSVATVWLEAPAGAIDAHGGLVDVRRLPSFHSITELASLGSEPGSRAAGLVALVGEDAPTVRQSMEVVLEMEEAGRIFGHPFVTIALDPRGRNDI